MKAKSPQDATIQGRTNKPVDWLHWAVVMVVFGITGAFSVLFSRFLLKGILQLEGEIWSGPWSYRAVYLLLIPPSYSAILVIVGTLFGKHAYFKRRVLRTWGRLLPKCTRSRSDG